MYILETERLILRKFVPDDWKDLHEYLSDEEVVKYEPYDAYTQEQSMQEAKDRSQDDAFWAVCLKENNKLIGNIFFMQRKPSEFRTWMIGYVFNAKYHCNGYATESCRRMLTHAFETLGAHRVVAMCNPLNKPSWKLLERLNMRREGYLLKNVYFKTDSEGSPIWNDTYEYAILYEEWSSE
ncbi:MAG: GNAT family N-acetyltransferase [Bacillota bacterium]